MLKAIIFDMDGVLVNTEPVHYKAWKEAFARHGVNIEYEKYMPCIGSTGSTLMNLILEHYGKDFRDHPTIKDEAMEVRARIIKEHGLPRIPGAVEAVKRLHKEGYLLALASSSPIKNIESVTKELGIKDIFDVLLSGEHVEHPKPAPDIFLAAAKGLHVLPEECLVIEDSTNGCRAAKNAGISCLGYRNPDSGKQDLSTAARIMDNWDIVTGEFVDPLVM